ncbi:adenylate/guanylate cyclase domain-containing protein [Pontibacter liquoris]|uniref:adenylate/guanylate cyclase domain-containing protein n=1 Tax=Pontibacter liquoris TaxID=2905677 RepID=UPI001FA72618|nr:adenylate/guanylate cyclase domain-containing protein [Pontibacter liquoris]
MKETIICQGCWEQMHVPIAIRGPLSFFFRPFGIKKSQMHPNLCTICESMFTKVKKYKQISISTTILFADIRGYTDMSQQVEASEMNELLGCFYDRCSTAVWENEGIVNKFIGDSVLAIFNFPLVRKEHIKNAVNAAVQLQKSCENFKTENGLGNEHALGVGIGIHTGECFMGEVGTSYKDFTAIGPVVNLAARLQGAAGSGEILVTEDVFNQLANQFPDVQRRVLTLKGINSPVTAYVLA